MDLYVISFMNIVTLQNIYLHNLLHFEESLE